MLYMYTPTTQAHMFLREILPYRRSTIASISFIFPRHQLYSRGKVLDMDTLRLLLDLVDITYVVTRGTYEVVPGLRIIYRATVKID